MYVDELYMPPCSILPQPLPKKGLPKKVWEEIKPEHETKKSFYPLFIRFAQLFKLIGIFPVSLPESSSEMTFSWVSPISTVSMSFFPLVELAVLVFYPIDDILYQFISFVSILIPLLSKIIITKNLPSYIKLIRLMDSIDTNCCLKPSDFKVVKKNNDFITLLWLFTMVAMCSTIYVILDEVSPLNVNGSISQIHSVTTTLTPMCLCYVVCYQLSVFYDRYHASLADLVDLPCTEVSEKILEDHRVVHAQLVTCVRLIDETFSFWLGFEYVDSSILFLKDCYSLIYGDNLEYAAIGTVKRVWTLFFIFYPAVLLDGILGKNKATIHYTFKMALKDYTDNVTFQVYYFMRQVKINKAAVSAAGLADVNKEIITSALALFATFYVATIQMEPQLRSVMNGLRSILENLMGPDKI